MRFALRNQRKIKQVLSEDKLNKILLSLKQHFSTHSDIETVKTGSSPFPVLEIKDTTSTSHRISFYIIGRQYDVYKLAFKEFI